PRYLSRSGPALAGKGPRAPLTTTGRAGKRALDILLASATIILLLPLLVIVAIAIKLDSSGPIVFRQWRVGFNEIEFVIFKFRAMTTLDDGQSIMQARRCDPRVTRVGRIFRSSVDELPQLFNVLNGDMSLVGLRPHALAHKQYMPVIAEYSLRHHINPA